MAILPDGSFSIVIKSDELARGLRPFKSVPRDSKFLTNCDGAVGIDGTLQSLPDISADQIDITTLGAQVYPYPQLFVLTKVILVCTESGIYEYSGGSLTLKLDITGSEGIPWSVIDFHDYIYMSNGKVAVERRATDKVFAITTDLPVFTGVCDLGGQVVIGAPEVEWT